MPSRKVFNISESEYHRLRDDECGGICLACGEIQDDSVEPDAENYHCDSCGKDELYGIEQALIIGRIQIT